MKLERAVEEVKKLLVPVSISLQLINLSPADSIVQTETERNDGKKRNLPKWHR